MRDHFEVYECELEIYRWKNEEIKSFNLTFSSSYALLTRLVIGIINIPTLIYIFFFNKRKMTFLVSIITL